jgi:hypothetical protein
MRVIVTQLLDCGMPRRSRAAPIDGHLRSHRDQAGRLVYQLYFIDNEGSKDPMWNHLIEPQAGPVTDRAATYYGFERQQSGQLVAQAWEVEPARR